MTCPTRIDNETCGGEMRPGVAFEDVATGSSEWGDGIATMSYGEKARLVPCLKCVKCGHSVTIGRFRPQPRNTATEVSPT